MSLVSPRRPPAAGADLSSRDIHLRRDLGVALLLDLLLNCPHASLKHGVEKACLAGIAANFTAHKVGEGCAVRLRATQLGQVFKIAGR